MIVCLYISLPSPIPLLLTLPLALTLSLSLPLPPYISLPPPPTLPPSQQPPHHIQAIQGALDLKRAKEWIVTMKKGRRDSSSTSSSPSSPAPTEPNESDPSDRSLDLEPQEYYHHYLDPEGGESGSSASDSGADLPPSSQPCGAPSTTASTTSMPHTMTDGNAAPRPGSHRLRSRCSCLPSGGRVAEWVGITAWHTPEMVLGGWLGAAAVYGVVMVNTWLFCVFLSLQAGAFAFFGLGMVDANGLLGTRVSPFFQGTCFHRKGQVGAGGRTNRNQCRRTSTRREAESRGACKASVGLDNT